jgi:hypothetical protein
MANSIENKYTKDFMKLINVSLSHHSPSVRKEAENFFISLYSKLADQNLESLLVKYKKSAMTALLDKTKKKCGMRQSDQEELAKKACESYVTHQVNDDFLPPSLAEMFGQQLIDDLKSSSLKKK